jgi:hypothetical protein
MGIIYHLETNPHNPLIPGSASFNSKGASVKQRITSLIIEVKIKRLMKPKKKKPFQPDQKVKWRFNTFSTKTAQLQNMTDITENSNTVTCN